VRPGTFDFTQARAIALALALPGHLTSQFFFPPRGGETASTPSAGSIVMERSTIFAGPSRATSAICAGTLALVAAAGTAHAQAPTINLLPPGSSIQLIGLAVSDTGDKVVGFVSGNTSFVYRTGGTPTIITFSGGNGTSVSGMSDDGSVIVSEFNSGPLPEYTPGWTQAARVNIPDTATVATFDPIARPPEAFRCDLNGVSVDDVSGDGLVIATAVWAGCRTSPALYSDADGYEFLPKRVGDESQSHKVNALNRTGSVAAGWRQNGTGPSGRAGVVWVNGQFIDMEPENNNVFGELFAVSSNGQWAAGQASNRRVYRWSEATGPQVLATVDTGGNRPAVSVAGITDNGNRIVGQNSFGLDRDAFVWTPQSGAIKLTTWLAQRGLDLDAQFVQLSSCAGMSGNGRYLTGQYISQLSGQIGPFVIDLGPNHLACNPADIAGPGPTVNADGELTADDVILFISWFTASDARADIASPGPTAGADGEFTADDIILFISRFTAGC
jgi:hypothetical protein